MQPSVVGLHPSYIRFADATRMPCKVVRAPVARSPPPFPCPRVSDPPQPSQTWRRGAPNVKQTFAPVCNRQVRKFVNVWGTFCPATGGRRAGPLSEPPVRGSARAYRGHPGRRRGQSIAHAFDALVQPLMAAMMSMGLCRGLPGRLGALKRRQGDRLKS